jgi:hypothetical protein
MSDKKAKFFDLPLGARFSYPEFPDEVWVVLERHDCGKVARWNGLENKKFQSLCSFGESVEETRTKEVIVRD